MIQRKFPDLAALILRIGLGGMMLTHGYPKMMKLISGDFQFPDPLGVGALPSLSLAVGSEVLCSILVIVGFKTRYAAFPLAITMAVAAFIVHAADPFKRKEMALLYLVGFVFLMLNGGGRFSVDRGH